MAPRFTSNRIPFYLAFAAALAPLFSGAVCNILIGLAAVSMLVYRVRVRLPKGVLLPLGLFALLTLVATLASADPWLGRTGMRKFYLYLLPMLILATFRTLGEVRALVYSWTALICASSLWSLVQFAKKYQQAKALGRPFYEYYTGERITGFMSHWMTLGGEQMNIVLLIAAVWLFYRKRHWMLAAIGFLLVALLAGYTRSIWLGTAVGGLYLIWNWRRFAVLLTPVPVILLLIANPADIRERVKSSFAPHGDTDSNQFRVICRRTGAEMIQAHPWLGLGPEQPRVQFEKWIPADVPRPLPSGWYGHLHNLYYHFAAERGIPALLVFLWFLGKILWDHLRGLRNASPEQKAILHGAIATTIAVLFTAYYEVNLGDAEVLALYLSTMALGYLATRQLDPNSGQFLDA